MGEKDKKYYWLKLKRDFFKRHDVQILEGMPNGKELVIFYLKLLCESVDHEGYLRFSEQVPYTESMLATITNTDEGVVRSAMKTLSDLEMIELMDDGTIYMTNINKMTGSETYWAEQKRAKRQKLDNVQQCPTNVQQISNESPTCPSKSKRKSKSKNLDNKNIYGVRENVLLTDEEHQKVIEAGLTDLIDELSLYIDSKGAKYKSHYSTILAWARRREKEGNGKTKTYQFQQMSKTNYDMDALEKKLIKN